MPRAARLALFVLAASLLWGCGSAEGAYADGMELETAGDYVGAAEAYALALERDRDLPNVAGRLAVAGREAIAWYLAQARSGDAESAAASYLAADALSIRAGAVGVDLARPATFATDRDAALAEAVDALIGQSDAAFRAGDYQQAVARLDRARGFRPSAADLDAIDRRAVDAYGEWAEEDLAAGRFRAALSRVDAATALGVSSLADQLDEFRSFVLDAGTIVVAVFPTEGDADEALFLRDLGDALVEDHLVPAPVFVGVVDPAEVRRWERAQRGRRGPDLSDSPRRLGEAALDVGADLGAVAILGPMSEETIRGTAKTETAEVRGTSTRASYTVREDELRLGAEADVLVVDASGRAVCDETVRRDIRHAFDTASYDGDWRALDLSRSARRLFVDDVVAVARDEARDRLRDALAAALADRITACASRQVP